MLVRSHNQRGVTLIELLIGLAIIGILVAIGAPQLSKWVYNSQLRATAEAIQNGLQLTRAEAVRRNARIRFQLTSTDSNTCTLSTSAGNWVVSFDDPTGQCAQPKFNEAFSANDTANNPAPRIIQVKPSSEGTGSAAIAAGQSPIAFNELGRQVSVTNLDGSSTPSSPVDVTISVTNPSGGACASLAAPNNPMRCLNVIVTSGGQIRMCDPGKASSDPQGC